MLTATLISGERAIPNCSLMLSSYVTEGGQYIQREEVGRGKSLKRGSTPFQEHNREHTAHNSAPSGGERHPPVSGHP